MYNLLLIGDNFNSIKHVCNKIIGKIKNTRLIGIFIDFTEFNNFTTENKPDIIIIYNSNVKNISQIENLKYETTIIIISNYKFEIKKYQNKILISNKLTCEKILKHLGTIIETKNINTINSIIINTLKNLKFDFKFLGTHYLLDCILYSYLHKDTYDYENLDKNVYPHIAKKNNTTPGNVKWAIIRAINNMYLNHTTQSFHIVEDYFCISFPEKPTNKLVISMIVNKLKF